MPSARSEAATESNALPASLDGLLAGHGDVENPCIGLSKAVH